MEDMSVAFKQGEYNSGHGNGMHKILNLLQVKTKKTGDHLYLVCL